MKIANLTLHTQDGLDISAYGLEWAEAVPLGVEVSVGESLASIVGRVRQTLEAAERAGAQAVLVGGHSALLWAIANILHPEVGDSCFAHLGAVCFDTERIRDEAGRFIFNLRGVIVLRKATSLYGEAPDVGDVERGYMEPLQRYVPYISD